MSISWDPKNKPTPPSADVTTDSERKQADAPHGTEDMDRPAAVGDGSTHSALHPSHPQPTRSGSLDESLQTLRAALRSNEGERLRAAEQALSWCSGYALLRSRGAKRPGMEILEDVTDSRIEGTDVAKVLGEILQAEGQFHELADAATADACHRLVTLLMALEERPS